MFLLGKTSQPRKKQDRDSLPRTNTLVYLFKASRTTKTFLTMISGRQWASQRLVLILTTTTRDSWECFEPTALQHLAICRTRLVCYKAGVYVINFLLLLLPFSTKKVKHFYLVSLLGQARSGKQD